MRDGGGRSRVEAIGGVEAVGRAVGKVKVGAFVIMPFAYSDGRCEICRGGLHTTCVHGGFFGFGGFDGAQAAALRVAQADGTLYPVPISYELRRWCRWSLFLPSPRDVAKSRAWSMNARSFGETSFRAGK